MLIGLGNGNCLAVVLRLIGVWIIHWNVGDDVITGIQKAGLIVIGLREGQAEDKKGVNEKTKRRLYILLEIAT